MCLRVCICNYVYAYFVLTDVLEGEVEGYWE